MGWRMVRLSKGEALAAIVDLATFVEALRALVRTDARFQGR